MATVNYPIRTVITSIETQQIAYPVGEKKDAYYIQSFYQHNTINSYTSVSHKVRKNWINNDETLFEGDYAECFDFIVNYIKDL